MKNISKFNETVVEVDLAHRAAQKVLAHVERAAMDAPSMPDVEGPVMVNVSIEWLAWMLDYVSDDREPF